MTRGKNTNDKSAKEFLSIRVDVEQKALVQRAAEREGLQVSSFIIMLLVRLRILPESSMDKIKRRPVPFYTALHGLLGVVNKIGGNCKQLAAAMPYTKGLKETHEALIRAAVAITDKLQGHKVPDGVNLYRLQESITKEGHRFNHIVKSVNAGRPELTGLKDTLTALCRIANTVTAALTGQPYDDSADDIMENAMEEMRANMRNAAIEQARRKGRRE